MGDFGATTKCRMQLVNPDRGSEDRVLVQVGMEGLKLQDASSGRMLSSYPLSHISRWSSRPTSLVLYVRTPVDVEEKQVTLKGDEWNTREVLDMLTCSCMQ